MNNNDIRKFIGKPDITIVESMRIINENGKGIMFLVDDSTIIGCITDGDIRRFILAGGGLDDYALNASNIHPVIAHSIDEAKKLYHERNFVVIPVVDEHNKLIVLYDGDGHINKIRNALNIPVVINAGGKGTRLDPYTRVLPKPLIPIGDIPIIELIMKEYESYCCNDFHIIVNYKKSLLKAYFADNGNDYNITWYDESKPLGTGGGLTLLRGKMDSTFFFANCDALLTANYESMLKFHKDNNNDITMICAYKNISIPYGVIEMGVNGSINKMKEKPQLTFLTNAGVYIVEPDVIDDLEDNVPIGFPEVVEMQRKRGHKVAVFPVGENEWMDMGQLPELEKMRQKLLGK